MLNPIKSPTDMLYEQAGIPHFAGGKKVDVVTQFASRIQDAIARYTRATGKPPSAEEVRQLEDHVRSLSQPSTKPQQTQARLAQQTPGMSHLVDSSGRAYRPVVDPVTGKLVTPERAMGYDPAKQFGSTPMNARAREKYFDPNVGQKGYVFAPDEFTQVANAGRVSTRTNKRSHVPSSEELIAKQQAAEEVGNLPVGSYQMEEGPRSMMDEIAGNAQALEALPIFETRMDAMRALRPRPGDPHDPELMRDVERVRQSFLDRNIQPDDEDIINGLYSLRNPGSETLVLRRLPRFGTTTRAKTRSVSAPQSTPRLARGALRCRTGAIRCACPVSLSVPRRARRLTGSPRPDVTTCWTRRPTRASRSLRTGPWRRRWTVAASRYPTRPRAA